MKVKYPRTMNLPWSQSNSSDDVWLKNTDMFKDQDVVVSLKLDGEGSTLAKDYFHARSLDSRHHASRNWVKNFHGSIKHEIPENYRICGENLYAYHSIFYTELPTYFFVFNVWERNRCLSWDETEEFCSVLSFTTVPVIYRGIYDEEKIKNLKANCFKTYSSPNQEETDHEGYVIRLAKSFVYNEFKVSVGKYVRENHVQTDTHWMSQEIIPNRLI